jgi:hypothetical protein
LKAFKKVRQEEENIRRPKSRTKSDFTSLSNDYGIIPSLRPTSQPKSLKRAKSGYVSRKKRNHMSGPSMNDLVVIESAEG